MCVCVCVGVWRESRSHEVSGIVGDCTEDKDVKTVKNYNAFTLVWCTLENPDWKKGGTILRDL